MIKSWQLLEQFDPEVYFLIEAEMKRQEEGLELIASENFASPAVIQAMANIFSNKYAEGRPGKRYYGGCAVVDHLENLTIKRVCELFSCSFANVQPHSGAQANAAVFLALAKPGDKILGLDLSHGGHLTHGSSVNFSGIYYESHFYQLDPKTERLDYNEIAKKAEQIKPKLIVAGASAYPRTIDFKRFREIADQVGAYLVVDMAHIAGLVAAGCHPSPLPHAHCVTTTTHKTLRGPRGGVILWNSEELSLALNKGVFPGTQGGPLEHIIASKAVCFKEALEPSFSQYQQQVLKNSQQLASSLQAQNMHLVTGGTDNHLVLVDLSSSETVTGKLFEETLDSLGITVNKNTVPNEKRSPFVTSGVRLGVPAVSSRGMKEKQMSKIAELVGAVLHNLETGKSHDGIADQVRQLALEFPIYPEWKKT